MEYYKSLGNALQSIFAKRGYKDKEGQPIPEPENGAMTMDDYYEDKKKKVRAKIDRLKVKG